MTIHEDDLTGIFMLEMTKQLLVLYEKNILTLVKTISQLSVVFLVLCDTI